MSGIDEPGQRAMMSETGEISFVGKASSASAPEEKSEKKKTPEKSWAQLKAERESLDQEIAREIAELGAVPKALRRARRAHDHVIVVVTVAVVAAILYALATIVWPNDSIDETTVDLGGNQVVNEEVDSMMDARRRLMKGQQKSREPGPAEDAP